MAGTFILGETKVRPGTYFNIQKKGGNAAAGVMNGVTAVIFRADFGPLNEATLAATSTTTPSTPFAAPRLVPLHNHIIPAPADAGKKKERKEHGRNTEYQH